MFSSKRISLTVTLLLILASIPLQAGTTTWTARVGQWAPADMESTTIGPGSGIRRREFFLAWDGQLLDIPHRLSYAYQPVLVRTGNPAHNGYFHQLDVRVIHILHDTTFAFTAGIHGSSNMFKHGEFHGDAAVATMTALHRLDEQDTGIGFFGDYRFNRFRIYPRLQFMLDAGRGATLALDLPVSAQWRDGQGRWNAGIDRFGEKWGTLDASRNVESAFYLSEWRLGVTRQWPSGSNGPAWALTAGVSVDTEVRYLDLAAGFQDNALDPAVFLKLEFRTGK